jgi:hypothetical protein
VTRDLPGNVWFPPLYSHLPFVSRTSSLRV